MFNLGLRVYNWIQRILLPYFCTFVLYYFKEVFVSSFFLLVIIIIIYIKDTSKLKKKKRNIFRAIASVM